MENNLKDLQKDYMQKFEELNKQRLMTLSENNSDNEGMDKEDETRNKS